MSCRYWAMNSMSISPPATYLRFHRSPSPFSAAIALRISRTSPATISGSRARHSTERMTSSTRAANCGGADTMLAPAKLPERQDRGLLPCDAAVQLHETLLHRAVEAANERIRQPGESLARLFRGHGSRHDPRPYQKHLLLREDADAIEEVLVRSGLAERAVERSRELGFFGQRAKEARIDNS